MIGLKCDVLSVCAYERARSHIHREREKCVSCKEKFAPPMFNYLYKWKETKAKRKETDKREWEDRRTSTFFIMWIRNEKFNSHPKSPHSPIHACIHTSRSLRRAHILNKTKQSIHRKAASWFRAHQIYIWMKIKSFSSNRKLNLRSVIVE